MVSKIDMDDSFKNSVWLLQAIHRRIEENRNFIAIFTGDTGSGKSYSAIRLAERVDPGFDVDRIVFTVKDFIALVNADLPRGSVILFDDAGLGINAREWQSLSARIFGMVMQGFRYKQVNAFFTVPKLFFIDRQSRNLAHMRFQATSRQGTMKMYLIRESKFDPNNPIEPFPKMHNPGRAGFITIPRVKFQLPSRELREKYEARKKEYMDIKFRKFEEEIDTKELEKSTDLKSRKDRKRIVTSLHGDGLSERQIARAIGLSPTTVHRIVSESE